MTARQPLHQCYELQGESLTAARALELVVADAIKREQPQNTGNLADIQCSWQAFYQRLVVRLEKENPKLLAAVGLTQPSTVIKEAADEFPRAYLEFAQIFASPHRSPRYFMYVPVDHNQKAFVPQGARLLNVDEEKQVNEMLFAGGWLGNAPIMSLPRQGIVPPADVAARPIKLAFTKAASQYLPAEVNFIAAGRALDLVRAHESALADYNDKMQRAFDALKQAAESLFPQILLQFPAGEGLYVNLSGSSQPISGADTCLALSIRRDGKGGEFMAAGQPVTIPDNPYFKTVPHHSDCAVVTRDDTPEGRRLAKILLAVPAARPSLDDHPELAANGRAPVLVTQGHYKILRYFIDDAQAAIAPPCDALPFPPAALAWLRADAEDHMRGDVPPPMPAQLAGYLAAPLQTAGDSKRMAPDTSKKPSK